MGEEAHIVDRVDWEKLNYWISWTFTLTPALLRDVSESTDYVARERLAGARERRALIDISEVAKASVRLINKKWTVYESCQN
jgi:hypothetical protein